MLFCALWRSVYLKIGKSEMKKKNNRKRLNKVHNRYYMEKFKKTDFVSKWKLCKEKINYYVKIMIVFDDNKCRSKIGILLSHITIFHIVNRPIANSKPV